MRSSRDGWVITNHPSPNPISETETLVVVDVVSLRCHTSEAMLIALLPSSSTSSILFFSPSHKYQNIVASAKFRPRQRRKQPPPEPEEEVRGRVVLTGTTTKSGPLNKTQPVLKKRTSPPSDSDSDSDPKAEQTPPFSGSDVLVALQRAAAASQRRNKLTSSKSKKKMKETITKDDELEDVRQINIRADWEVRLDEMDRLLQQLQTNVGVQG